MRSFKFNLGATVRITVSGEQGEIMARAEYLTSSNSYLIRYKNAQGFAVEAWWAEDALSED